MEKIKEQFNKVLAYSQPGVPEPNTDKLFAMWKRNKAEFIKLFGDKLIYELPEKVVFELDEASKKMRIESFISYLWSQGHDQLGRFLEFEKEGFYKNSVVEEYKVLDEKNTIITKNTKLIKAFKYFIKNETELNEIQSKASQLIQENKIEGTLCFSVHPLDYISISENNYNWRSCHALDGEYRAGNLSYMADATTIICYLKGEKDVVLPNFPEDVLWNNKKWRVLLYISNDKRMVFAGKQYPFSSEVGMNHILDWLNKNMIIKPTGYWGYLTPSAEWNEWSDYTISNMTIGKVGFELEDDYIPVNNGLVSLYKMVKDVDGSKHFNDVLKSSCYKPIYTYLIDKNSWDNEYYSCANKSTKFEVGEMTYCIRCGNIEVMDSSNTMMCYDCELSYGVAENDTFCFCSRCGNRELVDNVRYVNDEPVCDSCYAQNSGTCDECGDTYMNEELIYDERTDEYICSWCYNQRRKNDNGTW